MATGWLTWACLLLGTAGTPDDVCHMNQRNFQIPIRIKPETQADVRELILFLSKDQGKTWEIYSRAAADKKAFDILSQTDGLMWFSIAVVNTRGQQDPPDPYQAPVGQKILIDTAKPDVKIVSAERSGEEIHVRWEAREQYPDWPSLKLEYRMGDSPGGQWVPLGIMPGEQGNLKFKPGLPGDVTLRLVLKDLAGNEGVTEKVVAGAGGRADGRVVGAGAFEPARTMTTPVLRASGSDGAPLPPPSGGALPAPVPVQNPGLSGGQAGFGMAPAPRAPEMGSSPAPSGQPVLAGGAPPAPAPTFNPPSPGSASPGMTSIAGSSPAPVAGSGTTAGSTRLGALPPLKIVNKRQQKIEFDVVEVGPSGLGAVDVYVSTDEGATWEKTTADPNMVLPVPGENRGPGPLVGSVMVNLPKDGTTYGFYLVVKSRAGLGDAPPRNGDTPQIRIEVDTTLPVAELYAPQAEPVRKDTLLLSWKAEDRNLATNPVTMEWAPRPEGPWEFIGDAQLPNTGRYTWQVPPKTPHKVYLRLTVRDTAGNTAVAQTPEAVLIDLTPPRVGGIRMANSPR